MANILIVDDSAVFCTVATKVFQDMGHVVDCAHSVRDGLAALTPAHDVVFLDVNLPDGDGIKALPGFTRTPEPPEVIVITATADPEGAAEAVSSGAWDYVEKEVSLETLRQTLLVAMRHRIERRSQKPHGPVLREGIVGESPRLVACLERMAQAAAAGSSILLTGETGSGKELFARAIHQNSPRRDGPFVVMDGGSVPPHLAESIFFGHVRGAFTGAIKDSPGLLRLADGGTLFLDEVGELPMEVQKSFLRALQERRFRPVGGEAEVESDFRLVAATNKDLGSMVATGEFRSDLLYRLNTLEIRLPALRERLSDVPLLAETFFAGQPEGFPRPALSAEFLAALGQYTWPGNVRELFNALETAAVDCFGSKTLYPKHLPGYIRRYLARKAVAFRHPAGRSGPGHDSGQDVQTWKDRRNEAVAEAAKVYFTQLLEQVEGDAARACRISGLSLQHLYATLKKYDISARDWRRRARFPGEPA